MGMGSKNYFLAVVFIVLAITTALEGRAKDLSDTSMELDEKKETGVMTIEDYSWAEGPTRPLNEMEAPTYGLVGREFEENLIKHASV